MSELDILNEKIEKLGASIENLNRDVVLHRYHQDTRFAIDELSPFYAHFIFSNAVDRLNNMIACCFGLFVSYIFMFVVPGRDFTSLFTYTTFMFALITHIFINFIDKKRYNNNVVEVENKIASLKVELNQLFNKGVAECLNGEK